MTGCTLDADERYLKEALLLAEHCSDIEWYGVGCIIVGAAGKVIATGYSGESCDTLGGNRHAEDIAIDKALGSGVELDSATLYSTLEPCSVRRSGKTPCTERIIASGIRRVVYGAREPYDPALKIVCQADSQLRSAGIEVIHLKKLESQCQSSVISKRKCVSAQ